MNTSKQPIMDQEIISITCRQCKTTFPFKKIVLHVINKPDCRKTYTEAQMESLRMHSKEITAAKKRAKMRKQYDPARRAIKHYKKYDRFQRSQKYKKECKKVAEYYQKCKKDKEKRESDEGNQFFRIFDIVAQDVYSEWRTMLYKVALTTVHENMDEINNDALDYIFKSNSWVREVQSTKRDYENMNNLDELIEKAMESTFEKEVNAMVDTRAEKIALREYKLSVDNPGDEGFLRCDLFSEATKKAKEEAFATLFDDKFQNIYKQAYATTMNKVGHEDKSKDRQFRKELDIEIESCSEILKKKIFDMIEEDLDSKICNRFPKFRNDIIAKIKKHNNKRKEWACKKLKIIKEKIERIGLDEESMTMITSAEYKIEEFFQQFDDEITVAEGKAMSLKIDSLCFTNVANIISDLKSRTLIKKDENDEEFEDNFHNLIEKLWMDLEIDKQKCDCHSCRFHSGLFPCDRILRQRRINSPIRTCPVCEKEFPKDEYEKQTKYGSSVDYINLHENACAEAHGIRYGFDCSCGKCKK